MQDHNFEFGAESPQIAPARNPLSQDTAEVRGDAMKTLLVDGLDYDSRATFGKPIFSVAIFLVVLSSMVGISNCFVISADTPLSHLFWRPGWIADCSTCWLGLPKFDQLLKVEKLRVILILCTLCAQASSSLSP